MTHPAQHSCPQCQTPQDDTSRFCKQCRFPLLTLAGKYRLMSKLGAGGMGEVYVATHIGLQRDTERVVKIVRPEVLESFGLEERFRREVEVTSMLSRRNPHIVQIYDDFGKEDGLGYYYVMEYLRGQTLGELLRQQRPLPMQLAFHVFSQLCMAVSSAHSSGIIHRDLKPGNIFLVQRDNNPHFVKVIDFGLTRYMNGTDMSSSLTQAGMGTPAYMSPEQCTNRPVDGRTDIYSMGIILYELITGRMPYMWENFSSPAAGAIVVHTMQPAISMRERAPDIQIDPALDVAVLRALGKEPHNRYSTVEEFWYAVESFALRAGLRRTPAFSDTPSQPNHQASGSQPTAAYAGVNATDWITPLPTPSMAQPMPPQPSSPGMGAVGHGSNPVGGVFYPHPTSPPPRPPTFYPPGASGPNPQQPVTPTPIAASSVVPVAPPSNPAWTNSQQGAPQSSPWVMALAGFGLACILFIAGAAAWWFGPWRNQDKSTTTDQTLAKGVTPAKRPAVRRSIKDVTKKPDTTKHPIVRKQPDSKTLAHAGDPIEKRGDNKDDSSGDDDDSDVEETQPVQRVRPRYRVPVKRRVVLAHRPARKRPHHRRVRPVRRRHVRIAMHTPPKHRVVFDHKKAIREARARAAAIQLRVKRRIERMKRKMKRLQQKNEKKLKKHQQNRTKYRQSRAKRSRRRRHRQKRAKELRRRRRISRNSRRRHNRRNNLTAQTTLRPPSGSLHRKARYYRSIVLRYDQRRRPETMAIALKAMDGLTRTYETMGKSYRSRRQYYFNTTAHFSRMKRKLGTHRTNALRHIPARAQYQIGMSWVHLYHRKPLYHSNPYTHRHRMGSLKSIMRHLHYEYRKVRRFHSPPWTLCALHRLGKIKADFARRLRHRMIPKTHPRWDERRLSRWRDDFFNESERQEREARRIFRDVVRHARRSKVHNRCVREARRAIRH